MSRSLTILPVVLLAVAPAAGDDRDNAIAILKRADTATRAVKAVSYEAEFHGDGDLARALPKVRGKVELQQRRRSLLNQMTGSGYSDNPGREDHFLRIIGETTHPSAKEPIPFDIASDTRRVVSIEKGTRQYKHARIDAGRELMAPALPLMMIEFTHPTPFNDELTGKSARHEGTKDIGGVECDVIYVIYREAGYESRWYFSKEDSLPRRVERFSRGGNRGSSVLTLSKLKANPDISIADFRPRCPPGFEKRDIEMKRELLAAGRKAPNWMLKSSDGSVASLEKYRGNVVVIEFWATWCGPCKVAMPGLQKLHERFSDKPVKVIGISCWNRKGDPAAYMKRNKLTFPTLLKGDKVASDYNVSHVPTFYVIDKNGRVAYSASGFVPQRVKELESAVRRSLGE